MKKNTTPNKNSQRIKDDDIPEVVLSTLNDILVVIDFFPKKEIHATDKYKLHSTTLVLVATLIDGVLYVVRCDKTPKMEKSYPLYDGYEFPLSPAPHWDCPGGHLDKKDFPTGAFAENGVLLVDEAVFRTGAEREISEEIIGADDKEFLNELMSNLTFIKKILYGPEPLPDGGMNHEISGFFLLLLPNEMMKENLIKLQDDCKVKNPTSDEEETKDLRFYTEWVSFDSLIEEAEQNPGHFMDGLLRIVQEYAETGSQGLLADYAKNAGVTNTGFC
jgi:hypothetical protein